MIKSIFGKNYKFKCEPELNDTLLESIELYTDLSSDVDIDVIINITSKLPNMKVTSKNPAINHLIPNGLVTKLGTYDVIWFKREDGVMEITLIFNKKTGFRAILRKYRSMECPTLTEDFEQVLHELVLVPSTYYFEDRMAVHSSTVRVNDKTIMFAGTGGVGKSSAMLAVRDIKGASFIADDITVVSSEGEVFGNMAWPKIYGYNCAGTNISELILKGRGFLDKLQFKFKNKRNPSNVRRKIKPNELYSRVHTLSNNADEIYYLFREDVPEITISDLSVSKTKNMSILVMESEYSIFHNQLNWHEYNSIGSDCDSIITMEQVKSNWGAVLDKFLPGVKLKKVSIPLEIEHREYLKFIQELLKKI